MIAPNDFEEMWRTGSSRTGLVLGDGLRIHSDGEDRFSIKRSKLKIKFFKLINIIKN